MNLSRLSFFKKSRVRFFFPFLFVFLCVLLLSFFLGDRLREKGETKQHLPIFNCPKGVPLSINDKNEWGFGFDFSCYANYYRLLVKQGGGSVAILDLKNRTKDDLYLQQRCHELAHTIGRSALENASSPAEAFANGDAFCANGYYHGIMEALMQKRGSKNLSQEFLDHLCISLHADKTMSSVDYVNCSHALGHGIMYTNNNEIFDALKICDQLSDRAQQEPCWGGVFMENLLTDFREHQTKYLNPKNLMFPCTAVEDKYKRACYTYQSSYIFKITKSFEKTFAICGKSKEQYQDPCFRGIGSNAATLAGSNITSIKDVCVSIAKNEREQKNCVVGAIASMVFVRGSLEDGQLLCYALPENLQSSCSNSATSYYKLFHNEL